MAGNAIRARVLHRGGRWLTTSFSGTARVNRHPGKDGRTDYRTYVDLVESGEGQRFQLNRSQAQELHALLGALIAEGATLRDKAMGNPFDEEC